MRAVDEMIAVPSAAKAALPPAGVGRVELTRVRGRTVVTRSSANTPLKLLAPQTRDADAAWIFASTYGGGLLGGDAISLDVNCGADTRCILSTQASTKVYRSLGATSRQTLNVEIASSAIVVSAPDPIVCYAGARYEQRQRFDLSRGAGVVMVDWLTSGRRARGERWAFDRYESRTQITRDGRCLFRDAVVLDPIDGPIDGAMRMGLCDCFATVVVTGKPLESHAAGLLESVKAQPISRDTRLMCSASAIEDGVVVRVAGSETEVIGAWIRERLDFVIDLVGQDPWSRKW